MSAVRGSRTVMDGFESSPSLRHWHEIMRFKARVVCTFVRDTIRAAALRVA
jgi:hypothetical protein